MDKSEQWVRGGDCRACRKQKYCGKPCKQNKMREQLVMREALKNTPIGQIQAMLGETNEIF